MHSNHFFCDGPWVLGSQCVILVSHLGLSPPWPFILSTWTSWESKDPEVQLLDALVGSIRFEKDRLWRDAIACALTIGSLVPHWSGSGESAWKTDNSHIALESGGKASLSFLGETSSLKQPLAPLLDPEPTPYCKCMIPANYGTSVFEGENSQYPLLHCWCLFFHTLSLSPLLMVSAWGLPTEYNGSLLPLLNYSCVMVLPESRKELLGPWQQRRGNRGSMRPVKERQSVRRDLCFLVHYTFLV